ncbi:hypothetical protein [Oceanitalea stevensii]|uniref:Uncharacterized protein n=1 Tax=Oceanitalea stevensii TaxID=2763072 RepID=A0ABR8Z587_9MICO|nr:hypothetical protein [Oceanitalea stevensii]MBD8062954.1 hypothetical protein [Oceanitalea stevensii]
MDDDARVPMSGAQLLASFFASAPTAAHPAIRARVPRVRAHLLTYLDTEAEAWLTPDELVLVGAERQLEPQDAVVRVTGVEVVVAALPGFCHPAWLLPAPLDARAQLRLVAALRQWAAEHGELSAQATVHLLPRVDEAVRRAQAGLNGSPAP